MNTAGTIGWQRLARVLTSYWLRRHRIVIAATAVASTLALVFVLMGDRQRARILFGEILLFSSVGAGLLTASGLVSDERESGLIIMWFQKPGNLLRLYIARYLLGQTILFLLCTLFAVFAAAAGVLAHFIPLTRGLRIVPVFWVFAFLPAAIVFALSAWGVKRDAVIAVLIIVASMALGTETAMKDGLVARVLHQLAFPFDSLGVLIGSSQQLSYGSALLIVLAHCVAWSLIAAAGLRYTGHALSTGD